MCEDGSSMAIMLDHRSTALGRHFNSQVVKHGEFWIVYTILLNLCRLATGYITWEGVVTGFGDSGDLAVDDITINQGTCGGITPTPGVST